MLNILITGASSGIGRALAVQYANTGHQVFACGRNKNVLQSLSTEHKSINVLSFDINNKDEVLTTTSTLPELDIVILNAGTCEYINDAKNFDGALFERVIQTNLIATGYCLEALLPKIKENGNLALMSSSAAFLPLTRSEAYGASKAAMTYLAKCLHVDLPTITVSAIHPGFVKTPLTDKNDFPMPMQISPEQAAREIISGIEKNNLDIHFPKRFTYILKLLSALPFFVWYRLAKRMTK